MHFMNSTASKVKLASLCRMFDIVLLVVLSFSLAGSFFHFPAAFHWRAILIVATFLNLAPVIFAAFRALLERRVSVEFLAGIALIFAVVNQEWHSAAFISLMLVSARLFIDYTDTKVRSSVQSLLKLRPVTAHLKIDHRIVDVPIEKLKTGDLVVVDAGERIPVDGVV